MSVENTEVFPSENTTLHMENVTKAAELAGEAKQGKTAKDADLTIKQEPMKTEHESMDIDQVCTKQSSPCKPHDSAGSVNADCGTKPVGVKQETTCKSLVSVKEESNVNDTECNHQSQISPQKVLCTDATQKTENSETGKTETDATQKTEEDATGKTETGATHKTEKDVTVETDVATSCSEEHDPYFYTKRQDFTSEIFKIEIRNLPHHLGYGQLRKFLNNQMRLETHKIKPVGNTAALQCVYVTFKNEEKRESALKLLDGYKWKGKKLVVKKANPMADPLVKKRSAGDSEDAPAVKKMREDQNIPVLVRLKNAVTPLWNVPYQEQLKKKESDMRQVLVTLGREIEKVNKSFESLLQQNRNENSFQCCPLSDVRASPCVNGYRNKCEFTVGRHLDTNEKIVGFRLSSYKEGSMSVAEPDECPHISSTMLKAVKSFQTYIQSSDKDVYNPETHEGYWRQLTVRTSRSGDMMIIIVMHPQNLSRAELEAEKQQLIKFFESGPGAASCEITSAFFQVFARRQSQYEEENLSHLFGKKFIEEKLLGNVFRVSPNAFFQVNSDGAEVLYSTVGEVVGENKSSAVLDICCGTGTIGICLAKQASRVVGIEMVQQAVEDAKLNAQINGITNVEFVQGKAEDVITDVIGKLDNAELTAVVDPPRAGLHPKVLKVIRACDRINRLIYVSCNVKAAMTNFVDLCRSASNNYKGKPFYPVQAIPIDLFPHTPYCELVLVFERVNSKTVKK